MQCPEMRAHRLLRAGNNNAYASSVRSAGPHPPPPSARPHRPADAFKRMLRGWRTEATSPSTIVCKRATLRHRDFPLPCPLFYTSGYGHRALLSGPSHSQPSDVSPSENVVTIVFNDEEFSERIDITLEPDIICTDDCLELVRRFIDTGDATPKTPSRLYPHPAQGHPPKRLRTCNESMFRCAVMRVLRSKGLIMPYLVYAALSPFHERTNEELLALCIARGHCTDITLAHVTAALDWLWKYELVTIVAPASDGDIDAWASSASVDTIDTVEYNTNLGVPALARLESVLHGWPRDRVAMTLREKCDRLRQGINKTRQSAIASILAEAWARRLVRVDMPSASPTSIGHFPTIARSQSPGAPTRSFDLNTAHPLRECDLMRRVAEEIANTLPTSSSLLLASSEPFAPPSGGDGDDDDDDASALNVLGDERYLPGCAQATRDSVSVSPIGASPWRSPPPWWARSNPRDVSIIKSLFLSIATASRDPPSPIK